MDLRDLRLAFHDHAAWYRNPRGRRACWLWQFDDRHAFCEGRLEAIHLINRQRVRNRLGDYLPTWESFGAENRDGVIYRAEWDPRNAALGCTHHHRRFDSHATPPLRVPIYALRREALDFITDYGLETDAESKFTGSLDLALAMPKASAGPATLQKPESSPARYPVGQPLVGDLESPSRFAPSTGSRAA